MLRGIKGIIKSVKKYQKIKVKIGGKAVFQISYDDFFYYTYKNSITKTEISKRAGISRNSIDKMKNNEPVHLNIILAVCEAFDLEFEDVIQITKTTKTEKQL